MTRTKQLLLTVGAAILTACIAVAGTLMYFTDAERYTNVITVGTQISKVYDKFTPETVTPRDIIHRKEVRVLNGGTVPCYARVYVAFSSDYAEAHTTFTNADIPEGASVSSWKTLDEWKANPPTNWVYVSTGELSGYFYYTRVINPRDPSQLVNQLANYSSQPLFTGVKTSYTSDEEDDIEDFDIIVYEETVQTHNKDGGEFTGTDAWRQAWTEYLTRK